jgi:hypothetical protein
MNAAEDQAVGQLVVTVGGYYGARGVAVGAAQSLQPLFRMENCGVRVPFDESRPPLITERVDLGGAFHIRQITRRHPRLHRSESTISAGQNKIPKI